MSIESVKAKCIANNPDGDISKLDDSINHEVSRFEKFAKVQFNQDMGKFYKTYNLDKEKIWERDKLYYIHQQLRFLIDLFDYEESLKKSS